jgi:hypothetical protein
MIKCELNKSPRRNQIHSAYELKKIVDPKVKNFLIKKPIGKKVAKIEIQISLKTKIIKKRKKM